MIDRSFVHDMKNYLGIIIGFANLLLDDMPADDPRRADVDEIRKAGDGALALLEKRPAAASGEEVE